jgi:NADPH:quinone reductase-like Zn-dependent oxidoreductase
VLAGVRARVNMTQTAPLPVGYFTVSKALSHWQVSALQRVALVEGTSSAVGLFACGTTMLCLHSDKGR